MGFEFDADKSEANRAKHGIDFVEAQKIWESKTVEIPSNRPGENRILVLGVIGDVHWTAIITKRDENDRIISVRRSRENEKQIYKKQVNH